MGPAEQRVHLDGAKTNGASSIHAHAALYQSPSVLHTSQMQGKMEGQCITRMPLVALQILGQEQTMTLHAQTRQMKLHVVGSVSVLGTALDAWAKIWWKLVCEPSLVNRQGARVQETSRSIIGRLPSQNLR